jgi:hypothetical protein
MPQKSSLLTPCTPFQVSFSSHAWCCLPSPPLHHYRRCC